MAIPRYITFVALGIGLMLHPGPSKAEPLISCFSTQIGPPKVIHKDYRLTGGLFKDIIEEAAKALNIEVVHRLVPKNRQEEYLRTGRIHVIVLHSPNWVSDKTLANWSVPLLEDADLFVMSANRRFPIRRFEDLKGKRLGAMLGFFYPPELTAMFDRGEVIREDVLALDQNFVKLDSGSIDVLIDSKLMIEHYLKTRNAHHRFVIAEKVAEKIEFRSALAKSAPISIDQLNRVYRRMIESGKVKEILKRYR